MDETPKTGETNTNEPLKNEATNPTTPSIVDKKTEDGEVEALRKEAEQLKMERNQLRNKLEAEERSKEAIRAKELEEQNEFKTLYEQEKAKREEIERERQTEEAKKAISETSGNILSDYSDDVKALADDTGVSLNELTDEAVAQFKAKLDKIQTRLGTQKVTPNNPGVPSTKNEYTGEELRVILADPQKRDAYYRQKNGVTAMMMNPQA